MSRAAAAFKDDRLDQLAERGNVAQFVSFGPGTEPGLRHRRVRGAEPASEPAAQIASILAESASGSVNVRSFKLDQDKGCPFHYGLKTANDATAVVRSLASDGYFTIVNETVDVHDGGVSGVSMSGLLEFAPDDTPRAVEKAGIAAVPHALGVRLLRVVYGFEPDLPAVEGERLEFSIHPGRVGFRRTNTLWWESDAAGGGPVSTRQSWPNRFSRHIGDKVYGLLIADLLGLPVPYTTVVSRRVAPFNFGRPTGVSETWLRTSPTEQAPGRYTTVPYWTDPFALLAKEDPHGDAIASVLAQQSVNPRWSGATLPDANGGASFVQGVPGRGDAFMLGEQQMASLPDHVSADVRALAELAAEVLGPVRLEWVHDGETAWVVQMHLAAHFFNGEDVLNAGDANHWLDFDANDGLDRLRPLIAQAKQEHAGVLIRGNVGLTSHVGDLIRRAGIPGKIVRKPAAGHSG